jgi:two-component system CheB/CheR fusion protein
LFEEKAIPDTPLPSPPGRSKSGHAGLKAAEREMAALRDELASTQADLHAIIEEQEASNEELQSANEEILSSNEELQSTNEEMETAKEELQATNEELTTLNEEMQNRNVELAQLNNDLINLIGSVDIVILMLGTDLRIRRLTPAAQRVMNLIPGDVGRPLSDIKSNLNYSNLEGLITDVIDTMRAKELEIQDHVGRWYSMRIRPYKTLDNRIDGAVMVLVDIDDLKRASLKLGLLSKLFMAGGDPVMIHDLEGRILHQNDEVERIYGWSRDQLLGKPIRTLIPPDHHEAAEQLWAQCRKGSLLTNVPGMHWNKARQRMNVQLTLTLLADEKGDPVAIATMAHPLDR